MMEQGEEAIASKTASERGVISNGEVEGASKAEGSVAMETDSSPPEGEVPPAEPEPDWVRHLRSIDVILGGNKTIALHQEFLIRNNNSDLQVLKNTKVGVVRLLR